MPENLEIPLLPLKPNNRDVTLVDNGVIHNKDGLTLQWFHVTTRDDMTGVFVINHYVKRVPNARPVDVSNINPAHIDFTDSDHFAGEYVLRYPAETRRFLKDRAYGNQLFDPDETPSFTLYPVAEGDFNASRNSSRFRVMPDYARIVSELIDKPGLEDDSADWWAIMEASEALIALSEEITEELKAMAWRKYPVEQKPSPSKQPSVIDTLDFEYRQSIMLVDNGITVHANGMLRLLWYEITAEEHPEEEDNTGETPYDVTGFVKFYEPPATIKDIKFEDIDTEDIDYLSEGYWFDSLGEAVAFLEEECIGTSLTDARNIDTLKFIEVPE